MGDNRSDGWKQQDNYVLHATFGRPFAGVMVKLNQQTTLIMKDEKCKTKESEAAKGCGTKPSEQPKSTTDNTHNKGCGCGCGSKK